MRRSIIAACAVAFLATPALANTPFDVADYSMPVRVTIKTKLTKFAPRHAAKRKAIRLHRERVTKVREKATFNKPVGSTKKPNAQICEAPPIRFEALSRVVTYPIEALVRPLVRPFKMTEPLDPWQAALIDEREDTVQYLVRTATPGGTMTRQGPRLAIERLHPIFAQRLARAIREARANGLPDAGIFSAYRPAGFGVGGFRDKFRSNHNIGQAVDMAGVGRPGSRESILWFKIAGRNGIFGPYGPYHRAEWNHYQPQTMLAVAPGSDIRKTVDRNGPIATKDQRLVLAGGSYVAVSAGLARMWEVGESLIRNGVYLGAPPESRRRYGRRHHRTQYARGHHNHRHVVTRPVRYARAS